MTMDVLVESNQDSLHKRYIFKLITNLGSMLIALVTQMIVPRALGPSAYGNYNFLFYFFSQFIGFLDLGSSTAFYTRLSREPGNINLVRFYSLLVLGISIVSAALLGAAIWFGLSGYLWPEQGLYLIIGAFILGLLNWIGQILIGMADARGLTVSSEITRMIHKGAGLLALLVIVFGLGLTLTGYFEYMCAMALILCIMLLVLLGAKPNLPLPAKGDYIDNYGDLGHYFYVFCRPLVLLAVMGMVFNVFDRWLLQQFGGSEEQGLFGLANQISLICLMFATAMTPLLTREFSIGFQDKDYDRMGDLFARYVPLLYSFVAFITCFLAFQADKISIIMGGAAFKGAATATALMVFYPLLQTYGQMTGSVFYATGKTGLMSKINITLLPVGGILTFWLVAPGTLYGWDMGATGLAIKTILISLIGVNIQLYYNLKILRLNYLPYLIHQFGVVICFGLISGMTHFALDSWSMISNIYLSISFELVLYTVLVIALLYTLPQIAGLNRYDIWRIEGQLGMILRRKGQ